MTTRKRATRRRATSNEAKLTRPNAFTHREYILDRNNRINKMMNAVRRTKTTRDAFFKDPERVSKRFGVALSSEEIFGIQSLKGIDLVNLEERLKLNQVAFFDANCNCPGPGPSSW